MTNKYLEKLAGIPDLFPKPIGRGIERFMEGPANRMAAHVISNKKSYGAAATAGTVGYVAGKHAGKKEALAKEAGIGTALKAFAGHATGRTLHGAEIKGAVRKGLVESGAKTDSAVAVDKEMRGAGKGTLFESTKGLNAKKHLAQSAVAAGGGAVVGLAHAAGETKGENKYLDKAAAIGNPIKAVKHFAGHVTGKHVADAGARHAIENAKHIPDPAMRSIGIDTLKSKKLIQDAEITELKAKRTDARIATGVGAYLGGYSGLLVGAHAYKKKKAKK